MNLKISCDTRKLIQISGLSKTIYIYTRAELGIFFINLPY